MPRKQVETTKPRSSKQDPFSTAGGNGAYAKRQALTDTPNPQKVGGKVPYDYQGKDSRRFSRGRQ